jgi:hypothetical protein
MRSSSALMRGERQGIGHDQPAAAVGAAARASRRSRTRSSRPRGRPRTRSVSRARTSPAALAVEVPEVPGDPPPRAGTITSTRSAVSGARWLPPRAVARTRVVNHDLGCGSGAQRARKS